MTTVLETCLHFAETSVSQCAATENMFKVLQKKEKKKMQIVSKYLNSV